ncbi:hypothetical protein L1D14_04250 [Vibrio tubiashii]|uniref:hypothetical protein n=1 Tax=Vibrio tubiashii TaxID=29498 RepID=UPI001EFD8FA2|nr:hypothetical protein [Vibrio tubiashii]MCG9575443.1 hypothetical protein [Vibrio tubiashii]
MTKLYILGEPLYMSFTLGNMTLAVLGCVTFVYLSRYIGFSRKAFATFAVMSFSWWLIPSLIGSSPYAGVMHEETQMIHIFVTLSALVMSVINLSPNASEC